MLVEKVKILRKTHGNYHIADKRVSKSKQEPSNVEPPSSLRQPREDKQEIYSVDFDFQQSSTENQYHSRFVSQFISNRIRK